MIHMKKVKQARANGKEPARHSQSKTPAEKPCAAAKSKTRTILVYFPSEIVPLIDQAAAMEGQSRDEFLLNAVQEKIDREEKVKMGQLDVDAVTKAGHPRAENEWFEIGLSPVEVAMLKKIQAQIWAEPEDSTRAKTIRAVLLAALAHYDTLAKVLFVDAEYCEHEGFVHYEAFFERMIQGQLDRSGPALAAIKEAWTQRQPASTQGRKGGAK